MTTSASTPTSSSLPDLANLKVILHSNAPWAATGYGQQVALFAPRLAKHVDLAISSFFGLQGGVMRYGDLSVFPSTGSGDWGNESIEGHARRHFGGLTDGLVITLEDVFILKPEIWRKLLVASWVPVDHEPLPPTVRRFFERTAAIPIAMSRFGEQQLADFDPVYVPHGIDTSIYTPQPKAEARTRAGIPQDVFLVGVVGTNLGLPSRKSFPKIIEAFAAFRKRHDDALLYLHTDIEGKEGVPLPTLISALRLDSRAVVHPNQYRYKFDPYPPPYLADLYSSMDVLLNPSMGEGFGLTVLEAQACGTPAIVTDFSAMSEVCEAGWKVGWRRFWTNHEAWQALPDTEEIVESLEAAYRMTDSERQDLASKARQHALTYDVDRVVERHFVPAIHTIAQRMIDRRPQR